MKTTSTSLFQKDLVLDALKQSFVKLNPSILIKNPVMFTVEICTVVMLFVCFWIVSGESSQGSLTYNFILFVILLLTLLFANFAEAGVKHRLRVCVKPGKKPLLNG